MLRILSTSTPRVLSTVYPSSSSPAFAGARTLLDTISACNTGWPITLRDVESEETAAAIARFVDGRVDELLERRIENTLSEDVFHEIAGFAQTRFTRLVNEEGFERKIGEFVSGRLDDLAKSTETLAETFTPETVAFSKVRMTSGRPSSIKLPTSPQSHTVHNRGVIKREVDDIRTAFADQKIYLARAHSPRS